jgi:hypothetical protein
MNSASSRPSLSSSVVGSIVPSIAELLNFIFGNFPFVAARDYC